MIGHQGWPCSEYAIVVCILSSYTAYPTSDLSSKSKMGCTLFSGSFDHRVWYDLGLAMVLHSCWDCSWTSTLDPRRYQQRVKEIWTSLPMAQKVYANPFETTTAHPWISSYSLNRYCYHQLLKIISSDLSEDFASFPDVVGSQDYRIQGIYFLCLLATISTNYQISCYTDRFYPNHYYKNSQMRSHRNYFRRPFITWLFKNIVKNLNIISFLIVKKGIKKQLNTKFSINLWQQIIFWKFKFKKNQKFSRV